MRTSVRIAATAVLLGLWGTAAVAQSAADLAAVDAHVEAAPSRAESSVQRLASYLGRAGDSELVRARAVFRWVTANIAYDVNAYNQGDFGYPSPESVLRGRSAVCSGYAGLTAALGEAMGLEIEVVNGWSKGYGYQAGGAVGVGSDHAWNAVRVDGEWRLMDPTWGAGYIDGDRFVRRAQDHYFLTDPGAFIFDHFPDDPRWQLLEEPLSREQYTELVYLRPHFFVHGLELRSHERGRIATDDRVRVTLGAPADMHLVATILDAGTNAELEPSRTFVQRADGQAVIRAVFPRPGSYILRAFVKPAEREENRYDWALDYRVDAAAGDPNGAFPVPFTAFRARDIQLLEPFQGTLAAGETYTFRFRAPGAGAAAVAVGDTLHPASPVSGERDLFEARVRVREGDVTLYARYERGDTFQGLLRYTAR